MMRCLELFAKKKRAGIAGAVLPNASVPPMRFEVGPTINGQQYSKGMESDDAPNGSFEFPVAPGSVNYIYRPSSAPILRIEYEVTGGLVRPEEVPDGEATIALYFETFDNDWHSDGGRWWTRGRGSLTEGRHELTAPLNAEAWTTVNTGGSADLFVISLTRVRAAGFTFGGPDGAGHGVQGAQPGVRFTLHSFAR
jgi:hypothetical protein